MFDYTSTLKFPVYIFLGPYAYLVRFLALECLVWYLFWYIHVWLSSQLLKALLIPVLTHMCIWSSPSSDKPHFHLFWSTYICDQLFNLVMPWFSYASYVHGSSSSLISPYVHLRPIHRWLWFQSIHGSSVHLSFISWPIWMNTQ